MKRLLLLLLVLSVGFAVEIDEDTGCEKYSDHVICPQTIDIETTVKYITDTNCYSLQNEFGDLENIGCSAEAELTQELEYENCKMYVPFDTDILVNEIDYEYECSTERLATGQEIQVIGFMNQYTNCETLEEDEYFGEYKCPVAGDKYEVTGNIAYDNETYLLMVYTQEPPAPFAALTEQLAMPLVILGIVVLLVYTAYIWSERKK